MKHRMLISTIALAVIVCGSSVITVRAEDQAATPPKHGGHHGKIEGLLQPPALEKLNLTADQKAKYDVIVADFTTAAAPIMEKLRAERKAAMEKVEQILTADQKAEFKQPREERAHDKGAGKGGRGKADAAPAPQQ